ncbi:hypothetical protein GOODEAATRI_007590 [Goodea atripinnis]|uniref:LEM domain-containing protein n=1 Tax=Goodea atripinnis TaxID=208336 RepID=A0ABV0P2L3_9TELE
MASLSSKSLQEISDLLDEYGIKHGPVVESTKNLYVKKLKEAMTKGKKAKPSSDKTFYREEEEEVTYVYRTPVSIPLHTLIRKLGLDATKCAPSFCDLYSSFVLTTVKTQIFVSTKSHQYNFSFIWKI